MHLELKKAIDQISKDKGLARDMLIKTLEDAVRTSVQRRFSEDMDVDVRYNDNTGDIMCDVTQRRGSVLGKETDEDGIAYFYAGEGDNRIALDNSKGFAYYWKEDPKE